MVNMEFKDLTPVKIAKITSNDQWPLLYLPKIVIEKLGLKKGRRVLIFLDSRSGTLIIKPVRDIRGMET
jgi:bifunctional DNA-binding transcriptional regulator/antitoxin component of YhaV-PrlF toxin-antitoxin module